ncbi:ABC transporter permease [Rhizobium leucaenae]|uniref:Putative ABC transport system permease protein n=1 Tax=Rhizobium leucaenae TaxID=29450 RepID=A0A7W7EKI9_9HYPH|nr:FtsX-like permease family protein [Rhizobium leucaenae]MBB4567243.1 putative ABC transport system permease protein [Rhizobium leucaenae]MBB6304278.1 putative ABC transport system permease protein [Rhizobium leucaenae]
MSTIIDQSVALILSNLKSLRRRMWISLSLVFSVAMVVTVLLGFLAMSNGFRTSLLQAGSADIAIALGKGAATELGSRIEASQLHYLDDAAGIATDAGTPEMSAEMVVPVDVPEKAGGLLSALSLRGIGPFGLNLRPNVRIVHGRMFSPGTSEIVVGRRLARDYKALEIGQQLTFGTSKWTVVGIFDSGGSVFESEMLADIDVVQTLFNRPNLVQSVRIKLTNPEALPALQSVAANMPQIGLTLRSERDYFAGLAERTSKLILLFGWPLAVVMAAGAVVGAMTTMFTSVSDRSTEIATVRAIGFSRRAAFAGTWIEAMILTCFGCLVGVGFSYVVLNGWTASTMSADHTQIGFQLVLSPSLVMKAVWLSLIIGAIGGALPALAAARIPLRLAMSGRTGVG